MKSSTFTNEPIFTNKSPNPTLPTLPNENNYEVSDSSPSIVPKPFTNNIYNAASSKQNSVLVPSQPMRNECGVRKNVCIIYCN